MTQDEKNLLRKLNKRLAKWDEVDSESYIVQETRLALTNFYLENELEIKSKTINFTTRSDLTQKQISDLMDIAKMFESAKTSNVGYYMENNGSDVDERTIKAFETAKQRYPATIKNFNDYVNWIDEMENTEKGFKEYYDSKTMARIYDYGYSLNLSTSEIQKMMKKQLRYGKKTPIEDRYQKTINRIDKYYKEKE